MSTNHTPNYNLCQWVKSDQVRMDDFNADNQKIDTAIKAESAAREADRAALTELITPRNCRMVTGTYTGSGKAGPDNKNKLTFSGRPMFVVVAGSDEHYFYAIRGQSKITCWATGMHFFNKLSWASDSVSWCYDPGAGTTVLPEHQFNASGKTYRYFAILEITG